MQLPKTLTSATSLEALFNSPVPARHIRRPSQMHVRDATSLAGIVQCLCCRSAGPYARMVSFTDTQTPYSLALSCHIFSSNTTTLELAKEIECSVRVQSQAKSLKTVTRLSKSKPNMSDCLTFIPCCGQTSVYLLRSDSLLSSSLS